MTEFSGDIHKFKESFIEEGPSSVGTDLDSGKRHIYGLYVKCDSVFSKTLLFVCKSNTSKESVYKKATQSTAKVFPG